MRTVSRGIISLLPIDDRFGRSGSIRSVNVFAIGLVAVAATSASAGSGGFTSTRSMNVARVNHTATLLANGEVLAAGGTGGLSSAELYNPASGNWTFTGSMQTGRWNHRAVRLPNGQVLVAGGFDASGNTSASAELYNPSTGTWTLTGNMTTGREDFTLTLLANGEVLAAGGAGQLTSAELYDSATGTWTATGSMIQSFNDAGATLLQNGQVLAVGSTGAELYNPSTGTWASTAGPPSNPGAVPPIALLPSGQVWVGDGQLSPGEGDELFNPSTAQWTTFGASPCSCGTYAGALLVTGKVLTTGGVIFVPARPYPTEETVSSAALWDPSTVGWTTTGSLHVSRVYESMTLLANGQVLVAGGQTFDKHLGHFVEIASAELYTP